MSEIREGAKTNTEKSQRPETWDGFFEAQRQVPKEELDRFMAERIDDPPQLRNLF